MGISSHLHDHLYLLLRTHYSAGSAVNVCVLQHIKHDRNNEMGLIALLSTHIPSASFHLHGTVLILCGLL